MSTSLRYCAYCAGPVAGRADKLYCSPSCKSKDFRRQQAAGGQAEDEDVFRPATEAAAGPPPRYSNVLLRPDWEEEADEKAFNDEQDRDEEATAAIGPPPAPRPAPAAHVTPEQLRQAVERGVEQHALAQLPPQYAACLERVLAADEHLLTGRDLDRLGEHVAKTIAAYTRWAAGPNRPPFLAPHLQHLYQVADVLEEAGAEWDEEREPVALGLKKKFRAQLRTELALIARP
jgi:hypothetical protein